MRYWHWKGPGFYQNFEGHMYKLPSGVWGHRDGSDTFMEGAEWVKRPPVNTDDEVIYDDNPNDIGESEESEDE